MASAGFGTGFCSFWNNQQHETACSRFRLIYSSPAPRPKRKATHVYVCTGSEVPRTCECFWLAGGEGAAVDAVHNTTGTVKIRGLAQFRATCMYALVYIARAHETGFGGGSNNGTLPDLELAGDDGDERT